MILPATSHTPVYSEKVSLSSLSFFRSYLFSTAAALTVCTFCMAPLLNSPLLIAAAIGVLAVASLILVPNLKNKLIYEISLIYNIQTSPAWWNGITDHIFLGSIPLVQQKEKILALGVTHVVTLLEEFELEKGLVHPMTKALWEGKGIAHKQINAKDFAGLPPEDLHEGVEHLQREMEKESAKIYVHCKAGRGRSAALVTAYLWKYGGFETIAEAYAFVKSQRPQINLNDRQMAAIQTYSEQYPKI